MRRLACVGALAVFLSGCGDNEDAYFAILTSQHFRVHVYPGVVPRDNLLDTLEVNFRDIRAFLKFPETLVDYYLYPSVELAAKHCFPTEANPLPVPCSKGASVYSNVAPDQHELIHAYMYGVGKAPPPLLQEGVAEGVSCPGRYVNPLVPPWRDVVGARALGTSAVYHAGVALFVYLVRNFGVDPFVEYFGRARDTQDPDLFQADFESFWGISLDTAWIEMLRSRSVDDRINPICPCTQPVTLPLDGSQIDTRSLDTMTVPLPDEHPGPYLFSTEHSSRLANCAQDVLSFDLAGQPNRRRAITTARLLPERHYISAGLGTSVTAQRGDFVARTCAEAMPIAVPTGYSGALDMLVAGESGDVSPGDWFARFVFDDGPRTVLVSPSVLSTQTLRICSSCEAAGDACVPIALNQGDVTVTVGPEMVLRATYSIPFRDANKPTVRGTTVFVSPP